MVIDSEREREKGWGSGLSVRLLDDINSFFVSLLPVLLLLYNTGECVCTIFEVKVCALV